MASKGENSRKKGKEKKVQVALPNAECRKETSLLVAVGKKSLAGKARSRDTRDQRSEDQTIKRSPKVPRSQRSKEPKNLKAKIKETGFLRRSRIGKNKGNWKGGRCNQQSRFKKSLTKAMDLGKRCEVKREKAEIYCRI